MKYDGTNLKEVLEAHKRWIKESEGWTEEDRADLNGADLRRADLTGAYLNGAYLRMADLTGAKNVPYVPFACPDSGAFTAWKTCASENGRVIVKLLIPEDAKRLSSTGRKCRASKAEVLEIQTVDGELLENVKAWSMHDNTFTYEVGKTVEPKKPFCEDRWQECESGIHFFINRQEAVNYQTHQYRLKDDFPPEKD